MKKTKILFPILLSAMSIGLFAGACIGQKQNSKLEIVKAEADTATFGGIHSSWNPAAGGAIDVGGGHMAERYLFEFSENLGAADGVNQISTIGDHFQINGESLKSISTVYRIRCSQGNNRIMIDIPVDKMVATEDYPTPIFHIDGGTPFGNYLLPELTFVINPSTHALTKAQELVYSSFNNNIDYTSPHPSGVEGEQGKAPTNGAMMRIVFDKNVLGDGTSNWQDFTATYGENILLNGVKLSEINGALAGASVGRLYIFVPESALDLTNASYGGLGNNYSTLHIKHAYFDACLIPEMFFTFTGSIGANNSWNKLNALGSTTFNQIAWNNADMSPSQDYDGKKGILLRYNNFLGTIAQEGQADKFNLINFYQYNVGNNIKLNGVALKDIPNAEVFYRGGYDLWIYAPEMGTKGNVLEIKNTHVLDRFYLPNQYFLFDTSWAVVEEDVFGNVKSFVDTYMHMDANVSGQCVGYYPTAKSAYGSLSANGKMVFSNNASFTSAYNRLADWATYHGEVFNGTSFSSVNSNMFGRGAQNGSEMMILIVIIFEISLVALTAIVVIKRKRSRN